MLSPQLLSDIQAASAFCVTIGIQKRADILLFNDAVMKDGVAVSVELIQRRDTINPSPAQTAILHHGTSTTKAIYAGMAPDAIARGSTFAQPTTIFGNIIYDCCNAVNRIGRGSRQLRDVLTPVLAHPSIQQDVKINLILMSKFVYDCSRDVTPTFTHPDLNVGYIPLHFGYVAAGFSNWSNNLATFRAVLEITLADTPEFVEQMVIINFDTNGNKILHRVGNYALPVVTPNIICPGQSQIK